MKPGSKEGEYKGIVPEGFQNRGLKLCVRHEGYIPLITPRVEPAQGGSSLSVALQKGEPLELSIVDAKGAGVAGAKVYVVWLSSIQLREFSVSPGSLYIYQMEFNGATGPDGRCQLPPCAPTATILVTHESGFAVAPLADVMRSPTVRLGLYAQVEAIVTKNGKPAPGVKYEFHGGMELPGGVGFGFNVLQSFPVVSDAQGRISLPRVLPTKIGRFQEPPQSVRPGETRAFSTTTRSQPVSVGQVTTFELEVKESPTRTLTGRFLVQGTGSPAGSRNVPVSLRLSQPTSMGYPRIFAIGNLDEKGRFAFVGVPPGEYTLQFSVISGETGRYAFPQGQSELKVSIPMPSAESKKSAEPVDLGDIEVVATQK
jgi:hypothetical protein